MTRALQSLSAVLLLSSFYLALYLGLIPLNETIQKEIVPVLPFYALIVFGCYLLGRLGMAIFTFNDVPEAHDELQREIEQAKTDLRQKGIDVD